MTRTAVYAGTFDPVTTGHLDIIQRAARLVPNLIVAVAAKGRAHTLFPVEKRAEMVRTACGGITHVTVESFDGLLVEYAVQRGVTLIVRGLRAVSDFDAELQMASMNRRLNPEVETIFLMTDPAYHYLSASLVREIAALGGNVHGLVPPEVERELRARLTEKEPRS